MGGVEVGLADKEGTSGGGGVEGWGGIGVGG